MINLYQDIIMDHYKYPRNKGQLACPDFASEQYNPSCGDRIIFQGMVQSQIITSLVFQAHGCVISAAVASMLTEIALGKSLSYIGTLNKEFICSLLNGIQLGPTRLKCALLPLQALQEGIVQYQMGTV